jgi:hypothetical protein
MLSDVEGMEGDAGEKKGASATKDRIPTGNELRSEVGQIDNEASASTATQSVNRQGMRFAQPVRKGST